MSYLNKMEKLKENYETLRQGISGKDDLNHLMVALSYTIQNKAVSIEALKEIKDYLKEHTGLFSQFRSPFSYPLCGLLMSGDQDPYRQLNRIIEGYKPLKTTGFKQTNHLPMTLYVMTSVYKGDDLGEHSKKAMEVFKYMKSEHPLLTSGDNYMMATLLAERNIELDKAEKYYEALKSKGFSKGKGLQTLSHVLSFSEGDIHQNVDKCEEIYKVMKENKLKISSVYYPVLGLLCLAYDEINIADFIELTRELKTIKRLKGMGKDMHVMIAASLVTSEYIQDQQDILIKTTLQIILQTLIAQQQASSAAVTAAT